MGSHLVQIELIALPTRFGGDIRNDSVKPNGLPGQAPGASPAPVRIEDGIPGTIGVHGRDRRERRR